MKTKIHFYNPEKSFKQGKATWFPADCGTPTSIGFWSPHQSTPGPVDCKKCIARRTKKK